MADGAVIAFAATEFESDDLVVFELIDDGYLYRSSVDKRCADMEVASVRDQKNFRDFKCRSGFDVEFFDFNLVAGFDAVLFPACLNNCVCHKIFSFKRRTQENGGTKNICKSKNAVEKKR